MPKSNKYRREINGRTYYVHVFEWWIVTTVAIRDKRWNDTRATTYAKERKLFCEDVERFSAKMLSRGVQEREDEIEEAEKYDEKIEQALDIVEGEYDGG